MKNYDLTNKSELEQAAKDSGIPKPLLEAIRFGMVYGSKHTTKVNTILDESN